jgi:hypothetical protein
MSQKNIITKTQVFSEISKIMIIIRSISMKISIARLEIIKLEEN